MNALLHPRLANALMVYTDEGRAALARIYESYIAVAQAAAVPIVLSAPTWRANRQRLAEAQVTTDVNANAVQYMRQLQAQHVAAPVVVGGLIGCRNDCYLPAQALSAHEAEVFHAWQIDKLAAAGVDYLLAATLPAVCEAAGIARAMARTGTPYLISFVIDRTGNVLDGTPIAQAVDQVDQETARPPLGYMINCSYPSFLCAGRQPRALFERLIGFQANASSRDQTELEGADCVQCDDVADWGTRMLELNQTYGVRILGGCCGTGAEHLRFLVTH